MIVPPFGELETVPPQQIVPTTPAGWYPDQRSGLMRWWDGTRWTEQFGPQVVHVVSPPKDTTVAYLLLIFLGGLGIHRFYLGHTGSAVAMLALYIVGVSTSWFAVGFLFLAPVWIWQIVDLFLVPEMVRQKNAARIR